MGSLRRASPPLLALVVAGLLVLGTRRGQPAASLLASRRSPIAAAAATTADAATTNKAYLFKRTSASSGAAAYAAFEVDPFGCEGDLAAKKRSRDPFHRSVPYEASCPELAPLFERCASADSPRPDLALPWT